MFANSLRLHKKWPGNWAKPNRPFRRPRLLAERLEDRVTPTVNPAAPFELDGNVTTQSQSTHDWDQVFADNQAVPKTNTAAALASSFVTDAVNSTSDDIFTGGGSKDTLGIQAGKWLFKGGKPQGKDDITHAYAAAYNVVQSDNTTHLILYAGLDRFDNSGDSTAGFWFFTNQIGENPNVTINGGHPFTGQHADGDILLVSDFTTGGSVSTIKVFRWTGNDATGKLVAVTVPSNDTFAIVNSSAISVPWSYTNKSGSNQPAAGEFLEEGVDLTALGLQGCFSSFLAETRSSQSPTATLSDLVLGSFPLCSIQPVQIEGLSKVGDDFTYLLQVQNTGAMKLFPQNVTDTLMGNLILNGVVQSPANPGVKSITVTGLSGDGSLAPGAILSITVVRTVQAGDPDPTLSTTSWSFNDNAAFTDTPITATSTTDVNLFQPSATLTETASPTTTSNPNQIITYTFTVTNTSSSDSPNLVLDSSNPNDSFTDTLLGNLEADAIAAMPLHPQAGVGSVAPGGSFTFTETRAIQATDPTPLTDSSAVAFTLAQNLGNFSNIINAGSSASVTLVPQLAAPGFTGLSKVGDSVTYALTVSNTGPINVYVQNVTESLLGSIVANGVVQSPVAPVTNIDASGLGTGLLAPGQSVTIFVTRTVQAGDPDPTNSTVTFVYNTKADFSGVQATTNASDSVNLFQPSATLTETANPTTATSLGTPITYTFTVTNTSSADSPNLVLDTSNPNDSFTDTLLGNLEADAIHAATGNNSATVASIAPGASFSFTETRAIQAGDPNPLTDTSAVAFTLAQNLGNFSNIITAGSSASVTLLPHLTIVKAVTSGFPNVIHPGDTASFTITVTDDGAGAATNVLVTDQLPEQELLTWSATSSSFTTSLSSTDFLTATLSSLAAGASASVTVSAPIPLTIFGNPPGTGNGDPLPSGLFQLDGDATGGPNATTGDDWNNVLFGDGGSSVAHSFVTDAVNSRTDDEFTGGGSKDTLGIQAGPWLFNASKPQAKDDIEHAFAATYTDSTTHDVILYAGLDRFDNSGDSTAGFWFLQNALGENPNVTINGGHPFTGTHADGDILLVSDFTTGGSVSTIKVFRWTGNDSSGSLVAVATPPNSTFAIVNSVAITTPWSFTDKSHNTGPAPGEFLEEGVNLSALGLGGCFSTFLAETRSSQSPTATLSDFVLGSFNTCTLVLPNTATVQADGIAPITSNQVIITVVDGHALLANSIGSGVATGGLTAQQLQPIVAQAIDQWRAEGVDSQTLSNLANVKVHIGNLPGAELGFASAGAIWIDQTAAGWGWSTDSAPGRMDLLTVVTHELGHELGFEHSAKGVMEAGLTAGTRLAPEAAHMEGEGAAALTGNTIVQATQPEARIGQDVRGLPSLVKESSVVANLVLGQTGPVIVNRDAALTVGATLTPVDFFSLAKPTVQSPAKRPENGPGLDGLFEEDQEDTSDWTDLFIDSAARWGAGSTTAPASEEVSAGWQSVRDAYFAQENRDDLFFRHTEALNSVSEDAAFGEAALSPMLAAVLAVELGGYVGTSAAQSTARERRRFLV
jgi:uncharacterized repeat protein (TIGR01451 family)